MTRKVNLNNKMLQIFDTSLFDGELREQEPMSRHTSWKTGGSAEYYFQPANVADLSKFLSGVDMNTPVTWIGNGSNLLVRDSGISGVVISIAGVINDLEVTDVAEITVGAGMGCAKTARFAAKHGLSGIEFLTGIPGTIGGALAMNAGAYGGEIWTFVSQVETINRKGERSIYAKDKFDIAYRSVSIADDEWFINCCLILEPVDKEQSLQRIREMLAERAESQPLGQHSCGSVFRNPPNDHAARLIEDCGLKGKQIGGACVSEKHANFIINTGNATSSDIEQLIKFVQADVYTKHAITLIPEVRIIGIEGSEQE